MQIPFNKPHLSGKEAHYMYDAVYNERKISGNGKYTKLCQDFFEQRYGFNKCLLTSSCTDALEMCAILLNLEPGDEVIVPSYTFVSTANAFMLRGAIIKFADSYAHHPNINPHEIEKLITPKTKAVVVVHYGGVACDMDSIMVICKKHNIICIEDAAHSVDSFYKGKPLGGIGDLATFSFHETKNIIAGEGGMLVINNKKFEERAEIIWEKGTNRAAFWRGEVDKYNWVDIGSSFLPSEIIAAFLYAQLENLDDIQNKRKLVWKTYYNALKPINDKGEFQLLDVPEYATNNGHLFAIICKTGNERNKLIENLKKKGIWAVFHYISLHTSPYIKSINHDIEDLPNCDNFTENLVRLPLFYELKKEEQLKIITEINLYSNNL